MTHAFEAACIAVAIGCVLTQFILRAWIFKRLRISHPNKYQDMGMPRLILTDNWRVMRYFIYAEWRTLGDPALARVSKLALILQIGWLVLFVGLFAAPWILE